MIPSPSHGNGSLTRVDSPDTDAGLGFGLDRRIYQIPPLLAPFRLSFVQRLFSDQDEILPWGLNQPGRPLPPSLPPSLAQVARWSSLALAPALARGHSRRLRKRTFHLRRPSFLPSFLPSLSVGRASKRNHPTATLEPLNDDDNSISGRARVENADGGRGREALQLVHF